jgi:hypothetical protein
MFGSIHAPPVATPVGSLVSGGSGTGRQRGDTIDICRQLRPSDTWRGIDI